MHGVVEVIEPHRVEPVAALLARQHDAFVGALVLADEEEPAAELRAEGAHCVGQLGEEVTRRRVEHGVRCIEAQAVEVAVGQPHARVVDEEAPHLPAARAVEG